ncbi:MAG TPA: VCBS repeat-containing protein, partial [Polyangiaceae bacterium]
MRIQLLLLVVATSMVPLLACGSGGGGGNGLGGGSSSSGGGSSGGTGSSSGGSSSGSGGSSSGGSSSGSSSGGSPACHETGFATTSSDFTLPTMSVPLTSVSGVNTSCAGSANEEWTTIDLTGSGKLDLVLTETCTDTSVGTSHWLVYPNTGSGFSTTPKTFALPAMTLPLTSVSGANTACAGTPSQKWTSVDLTGDGKLDLVLTETCTDATVGASHWLVYANTGSGFSATPATFALPAQTLPLTSVSGANTACAGTPSQKWTTVDVNGDKKPDLVLTETCSDSTVGSTHWLVYANTGSGFATSPTTFALPKLDLLLTSMSGANTAC